MGLRLLAPAHLCDFAYKAFHLLLVLSAEGFHIFGQFSNLVLQDNGIALEYQIHFVFLFHDFVDLVDDILQILVSLCGLVVHQKSELVRQTRVQLVAHVLDFFLDFFVEGCLPVVVVLHLMDLVVGLVILFSTFSITGERFVAAAVFYHRIASLDHLYFERQILLGVSFQFTGEHASLNFATAGVGLGEKDAFVHISA